MAANDIDLTTVAEVQSQLRLSTNDSDAILQTMVTAYSGMIINYLSIRFKSESYTETRNGVGGALGNTMALKNTPITAISELTINGESIPASTSPTVSGYVFDDNFVYLRGYYFPAGIQNVTFAYTAGYSTIPYEINQACVELVCNKYRELNRTGEISKSSANQTISFSQADIPPTVKTILDSWKEVTIF